MDETAAQSAAPAGRNWTWRIGTFTLGGAILGLLIVVLAALAARFDLADKIAGFFWIARGALVALASGVIALVLLIIAFFRKLRPKRPAVLGLAVAAGLVAIIAVQIVPHMGAPALHDVTTDVDDPPEHQAWQLREDNLVPFENIEEWRAAHREGYPDIEPIIIDKPAVDVLADARSLAEARGWTIRESDPAAGRLEATAYAGFVRFRDHVVVEATPIADGSTRVDMRSTSEVGVGDLGFNARRVEEFLNALKQL